MLELRENFKKSTAATCFASEKIKYIIDINKKIHMKILLKSQRKDIEDAAPLSDDVFSYEANAVSHLRIPVTKHATA